MVCGRPDERSIVIDDLPSGDVHLLGHDTPLVRNGNEIVLPVRTDATPVWTLRIDR
jgi:hypothetical protein